MISPLISAPPAAAGARQLTGGGSLPAGAYTWYLSFVTPGGETPAIELATGAAISGEQATLTGIPIGPYRVTDRNIYRTQAGGSTATLVGNVGDNASGSFVDSQSDAAIASSAGAPATNTTQDTNLFELQINDSRVPSPTNANGQDPNYGWIGLRYAAKHELDANGTTVPERHFDMLCLGGAMYAIMAYLVPTADNFHCVDGSSAIRWTTPKFRWPG